VDSNPYAPGALSDAVTLASVVSPAPVTDILGPLASRVGRFANELLPKAIIKLDETALPGLQSEVSAAEQLRAKRAAQLKVNGALGAAFEQASDAKLRASQLEFAPQITVRTPTGAETRLDFVTRDPVSKEIGCIECKGSEKARTTSNQNRAFPEIKQRGATIIGNGKPGFPGGTEIPPTQVQIWRP
jgi:hypothetical protein